MIGKGGPTISLSLALAFGAFACPQLARAVNPQSNQPNAIAQSTTSQTNGTYQGSNSRWNNGSSQETSQVERNSQSTQNSTQAKKEAAEMVPATANLKKGLDARKVHTGQKFQAVLQHDVQLKNGPKLDGGTVLEGKVTTNESTQDHTRLALCFTQAKLKNGRTIPIRATIVQIANPQSMVGSGTNLANQSGLWNPRTLRVDQIGAISGADLHSAIGSRNSAVLVSNKNDIKLNAGDQMEVVIAPRQNATSNGA